MDTIYKKVELQRNSYPDVTERLQTKINLTQNFTTMVTGHGKNKLIFTPFQNNKKRRHAPAAPEIRIQIAYCKNANF